MGVVGIDCVAMFKRIYPENFVRVTEVSEVGKAAVITADFPDGKFYFAATKGEVSPSYDTFDKAKKDAERLGGVHVGKEDRE